MSEESVVDRVLETQAEVHRLQTAALARMRAFRDVHRTVLHVPSLVVGQVVAVFSGVPGDQWEGADGKQRPVDEPVVLLQGGHSFLIRDGSAFLELTPGQLSTYEAIQQAVAGIVVVGARGFSRAGDTPEVATSLICAALRKQLAALA